MSLLSFLGMALSSSSTVLPQNVHLNSCITVQNIKAVLGIRIRRFLGLPDPDPLVRGTDPAPDLDPAVSHKGVEPTEIMLAKCNLTQNYSVIRKK
jgi:hypothetical protein